MRYSQENSQGFLLITLQSFRLATFLKKEIPTQVFPVDIAKFLRLFLRPIFKNICERLLPDYFYGSLIHRPNGLRSIFYDSVRLQGPSPWPSYLSIYLFIYFALVMNRVPIRVRKSKTNTFDESINPAGIYLLKVNNRNTRRRCEICSKLTIKTPKWGQLIVYFSSF